MTSSSESAAGFAAIAFPELGAAAVDHEAVQRGYAAGLARGRARAERELADRRAALDRAAAEHRAAAARRAGEALDALANAADALHARTAPVLAEAERTLAEAALALAEAVLGAELARDPGGVARCMLDAVLEHAAARDLVTVRMHPDAVEALTTGLLDGVPAPAQPYAGVQFVADATLAVGDAVGELSDGLLDSSVAGALARARRALLGEDE